ncbi:MAG TPA: signal peptidase II [Longimicrobiaceae bacterium]|nr:signal peptidase II [Longimicrobiaceae bacterium]
MTLSRNRTLAVLVAAVVAADWLTKFWIHNRLVLGEVLPVIEGWVHLAHRRNTGVAFSAFAGDESWWRVGLLALASLVGIAVCLRLMQTTRDAPLRLAAALVLAGAVGNLGDRLVDGGVTDFILVRYFPYVFNVADIAITIGGTLLVLRMFFGQEIEGPATPSTA